MSQPPQKVQAIAIAQIVAGIGNLMLGWWMSSMVVSTVFGFATTLCTLGVCPIGFLCGMVSWLIIPISLIEIALGAVLLVAPDAVKSFVSYVPFGQIPLILIGDFVSPLAGLATAILTRDPEVAGYLEGM